MIGLLQLLIVETIAVVLGVVIGLNWPTDPYWPSARPRRGRHCR